MTKAKSLTSIAYPLNSIKIKAVLSDKSKVKQLKVMH